MAIIVVGPDESITSISDALTAISLLPQPLTETEQIEVKEGVPEEDITIPGAIQPSAGAQLHIVNVDFHRPVVNDVTLDKPHVKVSGLEVKGDISGGEDGQKISENIIRGTLSLLGDGATSRTIRVFNNVIIPVSDKGLHIKDLRGTIRVLFNTIFGKIQGIVPFFSFDIEESDVEAKFNIFSAEGDTDFTKIVNLKNTTGRTLDINRNIYTPFAQAGFGTVEDLSGVTEVQSLTPWQAASGQDQDSFLVDPRFKSTIDPVDLDVANSSPAVAAGDLDSEVVIDVNKTRRPELVGAPFQSTTIGAYEEAQILTSVGKTRILELVAGLSTSFITQAAVGDKGTISEAEYLQPETVSGLAQELQNRIFITRRVEAGFQETRVKVTVFLGAEPKLTKELLDSVMNVLSEVGLLAEDGTLFLRRTLQRVPFDPLGLVTTKLAFLIDVGGGDVIGPILTITAEPV